MEVCTLLIPVLWRQRQENLYEIEQVLSQPELHNETLSQKQLKLKKKISKDFLRTRDKNREWPQCRASSFIAHT